MIKEINDKEIMQDLEDILDKFLENRDCVDCKWVQCEYFQLCDTMCNLDTAITNHKRTVKGMEGTNIG